MWRDLRCSDGGADGIGMTFGHSRKGDQEQKRIMSEKVAEFKRLFLEKNPSCMCRELLGHDISKPGEMDKVMEKGLLLQFCPRLLMIRSGYWRRSYK